MEYFAGLSVAMRMTFVWVMISATIAIGMFLVGMYINLKKWGMGSTGYGLNPTNSALAFPKTLAYQMSEEGHAHHKQSILSTIFLDILFQRRILQRSPLRWFMHFCIFLGWMALFVMSMAMFAAELLEIFHIHIADWLVPETFRELLSPWNDLFSYILLLGIIIAIIRRIFVPRMRDSTVPYDSVLLVGLTIITVTGFISDGIRNGNLWGLGLPYAYAPPAALFHVIISLLFCIAYIPYSKYIHMIAIPLALLANKGGE